MCLLLLRSYCVDFFSAPEVLYGSEYKHAADWWTLGILMYALLMGQVRSAGLAA